MKRILSVITIVILSICVAHPANAEWIPPAGAGKPDPSTQPTTAGGSR